MITSHVYNIYETIPPLDTTWYTIWAKVIVIVATYRRVVTTLRRGDHVNLEYWQLEHPHMFTDPS